MADDAEDEPAPFEPSVEDRRVLHRRFVEARDAGLTLVEARLFAESDIDIGLLRKAVKGHCPKLLLPKIFV